MTGYSPSPYERTHPLLVTHRFERGSRESPFGRGKRKKVLTPLRSEPEVVTRSE